MTHRLFAALREADIEALMVSQGSSQHSICVVVPESDADRVREVIEAAFFAERHQGQIETLEVDPDCALLAVVGDGMAGHPGVAARFFGSLGKAGVNIRAIAQGSSERNISVVVSGSDSRPRAARRPFRPLPFAAEHIGRRDRHRHGGRRAARSAGKPARRDPRRARRRSAGARHRHVAHDASRRAADRSWRLARQHGRRAARSTSTASSIMSRPTRCRTP